MEGRWMFLILVRLMESALPHGHCITVVLFGICDVLVYTHLIQKTQTADSLAFECLEAMLPAKFIDTESRFV